MHKFTKMYRFKGWTAKTLAERWDMSVRNLGRIAKQPGQKDIDALNGLHHHPKKPWGDKI